MEISTLQEFIDMVEGIESERRYTWHIEDGMCRRINNNTGEVKTKEQIDIDNVVNSPYPPTPYQSPFE